MVAIEFYGSFYCWVYDHSGFYDHSALSYKSFPWAPTNIWLWEFFYFLQLLAENSLMTIEVGIYEYSRLSLGKIWLTAFVSCAWYTLGLWAIWHHNPGLLGIVICKLPLIVWASSYRSQWLAIPMSSNVFWVNWCLCLMVVGHRFCGWVIITLLVLKVWPD